MRKHSLILPAENSASWVELHFQPSVRGYGFQKLRESLPVVEQRFERCVKASLTGRLQPLRYVNSACRKPGYRPRAQAGTIVMATPGATTAPHHLTPAAPE